MNNNNSDWKFEASPDEVVVTSIHITNLTKPILLACHYSGDDGWAFLTGEEFSMDESQLVSLKNILQLDPSLEGIADLPPGWSAQRQSVGGCWNRYEDSDDS
jgi:hypothetical protein